MGLMSRIYFPKNCYGSPLIEAAELKDDQKSIDGYPETLNTMLTRNTSLKKRAHFQGKRVLAN